MPTVVTHALVGASLAPAGPSEVRGVRLGVVLACLAVLPDLDVAAFAFGIPYDHPLGHRGLSHSLPFALLVAWWAARLAFPSLPPGTAPWWRLFGLLALATASHGLLDAMTNGGLGVGFFLPLSSARHFFAFRPLVVSPIGPEALFDDRMVRVLCSEIAYVWIPLAAVQLVALAARKRTSRGA